MPADRVIILSNRVMSNSGVQESASAEGLQREKIMRNVWLGGALCGVLLSAVAIGASEPSVSALIEAAKSGEESSRIKAIDSLAAKAKAAGEAVPALAELLKDDSA